VEWWEFYEKYADWADPTRRTRISALEDIGPGAEVVEVVMYTDDPKVKAQLIRKAMELEVEFSQDDFSNLYGELPDELYAQVGQYAGFDPENPYFEEAEASPAFEEEAEAPVGFWGFLGALFGSSGRSHRCDGNCAACPAHYGYRYGRWYYGHGHQYGCERGGNGGQTGRTYKD